MPADAGPSVPSQAKQEQSGAGFICTPDQLYMHVVGSYPSQEAFGYPGDHDSHGQSPIARSRADENEDAGASARAKKRRKTQRRAKVSEIWFPKAEMAFCTSEYLCLPPLSLTKAYTPTGTRRRLCVASGLPLPPPSSDANPFLQVSLAFLLTVERKSNSLAVPSAATSLSLPSAPSLRGDYTTESKYPVILRF